MSKIGRRQGIQKISAGFAGFYSLLAFSPLKAFAETMAKNLVDEAASKHLNNKFSREKSRKLLHVNLSGAPTRWYYDHLLKPSDHHEYVSHPIICTELLPPDPLKPLSINNVYKTAKMKGYNFPTLWLNDVPKAGGGWRPMADLQNHMLMIRGCDMQVDGHPINTMKQVTNTQDDVSITGLAADGSKLLMPAISMGSCTATNAFKGKLIRKAIEIPYENENYMDFLFSAFYEKPAEAAEFAEAEEAAMQIIESVYSSNRDGSGVLFNERNQARALIRKKIKNLHEVYAALVSKYEDLLTRSHSKPNIAGLTEHNYDFPKLPVTLKGEYTESQLKYFIQCYSIRGPICETPFSELAKSIAYKKMAQQLAIAEFCLTENLSASVTISPYNSWAYSDNRFDFMGHDEQAYNCIYDSKSDSTLIKRGQPVKNISKDARFDSHALGFLLEFLMANHFYMGFAASMLELTDRLKEVKYDNTNLFNETVIHVASEFEREPLKDMYFGTDHNWRAGVSAMYSGIIKKPLLVGNIFTDSNDDVRRGTRGDAAPMASLNNTNMNHRHVLSTLSEMLKVDRVVARAKPLIEIKNDEVVSVIEEPKNIPREGKRDKV